MTWHSLSMTCDIPGLWSNMACAIPWSMWHETFPVSNDVIHYTIMDFLLSKYGLILTEFDSIDRGGAEVNTFKFSKYQTIFTE